MTREEAIIHLENMHMKYDEFYHNLNCSDQLLIERGNEALDMAINALKAIDEIIDYLHDGSVTWRDITDDIIADIVKKHMGEQK